MVEEKSDDQDFDHISTTDYQFDDLEAFTDAAIDGKPKNHDLFYYGMRPQKPDEGADNLAQNVTKAATNSTKAANNVTEEAVKALFQQTYNQKAASRAQAIKDAEDEDEYDTHINFDNIDNTSF